MPMQDVEKFYDALKTNQGLRDAIQGVQDNVVALASSHGYKFTFEELMEHLGEIWGADFESDTETAEEPQTCTCI
jgi:predicted ribosomally synthesized peptide with nif11-like leader